MTNALTKNPSVLSWIEDKVALVQPDQIVWIDGSEDQLNALRAEACSTGEMPGGGPYLYLRPHQGTGRPHQ